MSQWRFEKQFFEDEVRCGFYIPTIVKQAWAASLTVLGEIDRVCKKHGIAYFADWGTILGAVRHGGFVPWDDDLDICMKREDYDKFRQVADSELPSDFAIHDFRRKDNHWLFLSRVVNKNQICFEEEHLEKYHNFPYIASVDIFVKDYIYRDESKEKERCDEVMKIVTVADKIVEGRINKETKEYWLAHFEKKYNYSIDRKLDNVGIGIELYELAQQQMSRTKATEADKIEQIFPWGLKGAKGLPKEYYDSVIRLPFENTTVPVPSVYNEMLENRYGNYLKAIKVWDGHEYPYFEGQRANLQEVADFELPEFKYDKRMLRENIEDVKDEGSLRYFADEYVRVISELTNNLCQNPLYDLDRTSDLLNECQQMAVDLGSLYEQVRKIADDCDDEVIASLSGYCDSLYGLYGVLESGQYDDKVIADACIQIEMALNHVKEKVKKYISDRKQVLFIGVDPKRWSVFRKLYDYHKTKADTDVTVLALPHLFKDIYGNINADNSEILASSREDEYPQDVIISDWTTYDLMLNKPDIIYIHDSYDAENPCLTIPPQFYTDKLQLATQRLVCVQPVIMNEFEEEDYCDWHNMKYYVTAPGTIRADRILVQSEHMKQMYIKKLTQFAGEETQTMWEQKVRVIDEEIKNEDNADADVISEKACSKKQNKKMVYCIGANEVMEHKEHLIDNVIERLSIFEANKDKVSVSIVLYPMMLSADNQVFGNIVDDLKKLLKDYESKDWCELVSGNHEQWGDVSMLLVEQGDAYYGSPSPLSNMFVNAHKPVMISSYDK